MKFVTTRDEQGKEELFIFPRHINHSEFAGVLSNIRTEGAMSRHWDRLYREPIAAGFVATNCYPPSCYGRSETLDLKARPEDTELLRRQGL